MFLTIIIFTFVTCAIGEIQPTVDLPLGKLEGTIKRSAKGRPFYAFEGVPYAEPPIGNLRFKESVPKKPWVDIWKANTTYTCLQYSQVVSPGQDRVSGDEDCLYMNIYTPSLNPKELLDVIVYIHGGVLMFSYCGRGPDILLDKDVVYININYRVGPLGFLSTDDEVVPGNNGLKDQSLAFQWIQQYIRYFGGNPDSVMIMGLSAGGSSVQLHYLSPKSKGLFQKGFSQSGTALCSWILTENPRQKAEKLASIVGCNSKDSREMVDCLRNRPGRQIVQAVAFFKPWLYNPLTPFGAVVDKWSSDPFLPDHPYVLLKQKKVADLPWMVSFTSAEGLYPASEYYADNYLEDIDNRWNELMPLILDYNDTVDSDLHNEVSAKIREYYMKDLPVTKETYKIFLEAVSDRIFVADIEKAARLHSNAVKADVFAYMFTYRGAHSVSEIQSGSTDDLGVSHGDDASYFLENEVDTSTTEEDRAMTALFLELITSFARNGKPNVPSEWIPLTKQLEKPFNYLKIASPTSLSMEEQQFLGNRPFWDSLPIMENEKLYISKREEL